MSCDKLDVNAKQLSFNYLVPWHKWRCSECSLECPSPFISTSVQTPSPAFTSSFSQEDRPFPNKPADPRVILYPLSKRVLYDDDPRRKSKKCRRLTLGLFIICQSSVYTEGYNRGQGMPLSLFFFPSCEVEWWRSFCPS